MDKARERKKRQMATEKKRREKSTVASCQKEFDGPHKCTKCEKDFYSREFIEDGEEPVCALCKRLIRRGINPLPRLPEELGESDEALFSYIRRCEAASST